MTKEEPKFSCEVCEREFKSREALEMHKKAKHSESRKRKEKEKSKKSKTGFKKIRNWMIFIFIAGLLIWFVVWAVSSMTSYNGVPVTEMNIGSHQNIAFHYHADLTILVDGVENEIPANIGVSSGVMRPLHTHDSSGKIHIEGPQPRDFTLGEFFQIWGRTFNEECIFDNCIDSGTLEMMVNGVQNEQFGNYILRDHDNIVIEYISN